MPGGGVLGTAVAAARRVARSGVRSTAGRHDCRRMRPGVAPTNPLTAPPPMVESQTGASPAAPIVTTRRQGALRPRQRASKPTPLPLPRCLLEDISRLKGGRISNLDCRPTTADQPVAVNVPAGQPTALKTRSRIRTASATILHRSLHRRKVQRVSRGRASRPKPRSTAEPVRPKCQGDARQ